MTRRTRTALLPIALIWTFAACAADDDAPAAEGAVIADPSTHKPGVGLCGVYESARSVCVERLSESSPRRVERKTSRVEHSFVESRSEAFKKLGVSNATTVQATVAGLAGIEATQQAVFDSQFRFSRDSIVLIVKVEYESHSDQYETDASTTRIKEEFRRRLPTDEDADWLPRLHDFRRKCGDKYLTSTTFGGSYFAMLEFDIAENEVSKKSDIKAKLSADIQAVIPLGPVSVDSPKGSLEGGLSKESKDFLSTHAYRLVERKRGGSPLAREAVERGERGEGGSRLVEIISYAAGVAKDIAESPVAIESNFEDYVRLDDFAAPGAKWEEAYFKDKYVPAISRMAAMASIGAELTDLASKRPPGLDEQQLERDKKKLGALAEKCGMEFDCLEVEAANFPSLLRPPTWAVDVTAPPDLADRLWSVWDLGYRECFLRVSMTSPEGAHELARTAKLPKCVVGKTRLEVPVDVFDTVREQLGAASTLHVEMLDQNFGRADGMMAELKVPVAELGDGRGLKRSVNVRGGKDVVSLFVDIAKLPARR